ncbi:hypothetical protein TNCV_4272761 [Trichonephila clavipes]|nr:hypothetical protein TNCV_4272761 [Trichonephila clavipes]
MNQLTSFIDASLVYGSSEETMRKIRENGGQGAKLIMDRLGDWTLLPRRNRTCKSGHRVCDKRALVSRVLVLWQWYPPGYRLTADVSWISLVASED